MAVANKAFRISKLNTPHVTSYNVLSSTPQSSTAHATSVGISATEAIRRLSLLCDEGLAVQARATVVGKDGKTYLGATLDSFTQAS